VAGAGVIVLMTGSFDLTAAIPVLKTGSFVLMTDGSDLMF